MAPYGALIPPDGTRTYPRQPSPSVKKAVIVPCMSSPYCEGPRQRVWNVAAGSGRRNACEYVRTDKEPAMIWGLSNGFEPRPPPPPPT